MSIVPVAPSPEWNLVEVRLRANYLDGKPAKGSVIAVPRLRRFLDDDVTHPFLIVGKEIEAKFDDDGLAVMHLPVTNDPNIVPRNFTYAITEKIVGERPNTYDIEVPYQMAASGIELARAQTIAPSTGEVVWTKGMILNGSGPPGASIGSVSDFYIDKENLEVYGPKTTFGGWGTGAAWSGMSGAEFRTIRDSVYTYLSATITSKAAAEAAQVAAEAARDLAIDISNIDDTDDAVDVAYRLPVSKTRVAIDEGILARFLNIFTGAVGQAKNVIVGGVGAGASIAPDVGTSVILNPGSAAYNNVIGGDGANVGTVTPNTTQTGTTANVSLVGGYDNSAGSLSSKIISDHSKTEIGGSGHNAIYGGANHTAYSGAGFAGIFAGSKNKIRAMHSSIVGGLENDSSSSGGIMAGIRNLSSAAATCTSVFGSDNIVTAAYANVRGLQHDVGGSYGDVSGSRASTDLPWQRAYGGGGFGAAGRNELGSAQESEYLCFALSTDASNKTLGPGGGSIGPLVPLRSAWAYKVLIIGQDTSSGAAAAWEVKGTIRRGSSGASIPVGAAIITPLGADSTAATWTCNVVGGSTGGLNVYCNGEVGKTIRWVGYYDVAQVKMPPAV